MNVVALICARGGSKGIPGKNVKSLGGLPLIAWSVRSSLGVQRVQRVIVSTDSDEIAEAAAAAGAEIPFMRPPELAGDRSPEWKVWQHALKFVRNDSGSFPDALLVVPPTAPLRLAEDLNSCLDVFEEHSPDMVITVREAHCNPYYNMVTGNSTFLPNLLATV
ncbi:acylneuraminate cytidylyltransferase family protein [Verrucomicrobiales bacterium]|nr:acylneuraminate cytidylyltransferase family protein [Verrucomicrobiales bacterium]